MYYSHTLRRVLNLAVLLTMMLSLLGQSPARADTPADPTGPAQGNRTLYLPLLQNDQVASSDQLIDAALARGEISRETALLYHTFAVFGDARLPAAYRGDGTTKREVAGDIASQYNSLSAQSKETLAPFLLPPYHAGSWWDEQQAQRQGRVAPAATTLRCGMQGGGNEPRFNEWHYIDTPSGAIRIWWQARYPEDAAKAKALAPVADDAWLRLTALMGRTPPSDKGSTTFCRGGSDHYDISFVDIFAAGSAHRYDYNPKASPSYMLLRRNAKPSTVVHELMHAFQYAFDMATDIDEYAWWREATATWALDYVNPTQNDEHEFASSMLNQPEEELESRSIFHHYGAYLFAQTMVRQRGAAVVRQSFEEFGKSSNSLQALNKLLDGGFEKQWPKFALLMMNRPPVDDFKKHDQLEEQVKFKLDTAATLNGKGDQSYELDGNVKHLASHHYRFTFNDANVRSVAFVNPLIEQPQEMARIQALVKIGGVWKQEDWTDVPLRTLCRDVKAERVEELMIIISNHEWSNRNHKLAFSKPPRLNVTNVACRGWDFEITSALRVTSPSENVTEDTVATGRWERNFAPEDPNEGRIFEHYQAHNVKANWKHVGSRSDCSVNTNGNVTLPGGANSFLSLWNNALDPTGREYVPGRRVYNGFGVDTVVFFATKVTYNCSDGSTYTTQVETLSRWFATETAPTQSVSADGKQINGTFKTEQFDPHTNYRKVITYTWKMTALPPE